ncbi:MAG: alcohol dehydrogenase catalytic domain-containing protein [Pseudomonadota bacterium]
MRAAVFNSFRGPISIETVDDPDCAADGVVVKVEACGVCRSDYHAWNGADPSLTFPHVMGHEMAGTVLEAGPETKWKPGARVTAPFILGCGTCHDCRSGHSTLCDHQEVMGFSRWGAFAQYVSVPKADFNLVRLPDEMDFVHAAGMGCRVTTAYRALAERACLKADEWLCVHGCGGIGLSAIAIAKAAGAGVVAVDTNAQALSLARQLGADVCIQPHNQSSEMLAQAIHDATDGGAHVSMDALGHTQTFQNSLRSLRKAGRHLQIGFPIGDHAVQSLPLLDLVYGRQISILGSRGMSPSGFEGLFKTIQSGQLDLEQLVSRRLALTELEAALTSMGHFASAGVSVVDQF